VSRFALVLVAACGSGAAPVPSNAAPPPAPIDAKWRCDQDADCLNSCAQGAVSTAWYAGAHVAECEDGCANVLAAAPRCIDHACVAFVRSPQDPKQITRADDCTHKP